MAATLLTSPSHFQFKESQLSRKLLSNSSPPYTYTPPHSPITVAGAPQFSSDGSSSNPNSFTSLNSNVVVILAVLVCSVICALILNAIARCGLAILNRVRLDPDRTCALDCSGRARERRREASKKALPCCLVYYPGLGLPRAKHECAICLSEFAPGERVRVLPECNHGFHVGCIDRWLMSRPSCPTCRHSLQSYVVEVGFVEQFS